MPYFTFIALSFPIHCLNVFQCSSHTLINLTHSKSPCFVLPQVRRAEECGAIGVILYPDPSEVVEDDGLSNSETGATFPKTRFLPGWASVRATLWRFGDPLTPGLPSKGHSSSIFNILIVC